MSLFWLLGWIWTARCRKSIEEQSLAPRGSEFVPNREYFRKLHISAHRMRVKNADIPTCGDRMPPSGAVLWGRRKYRLSPHIGVGGVKCICSIMQRLLLFKYFSAFVFHRNDHLSIHISNLFIFCQLRMHLAPPAPRCCDIRYV